MFLKDKHQRRVGPKDPGSGAGRTGMEGRERACLLEVCRVRSSSQGWAAREVWLGLESGEGRGKAAPGQALSNRTAVIFMGY